MFAHAVPRGDTGIGSWISRRARISPDTVALRQGCRAVSYRTLARRVDDLARGLLERGVLPGDRIAYLAANDIAGLEVFFAATRIGALFVPLNNRLTAAEIALLVQDCEPRLVFHDSTRQAVLTAGGPARVLINSAAHDAIAGSGAASTRQFPRVGLEQDAVILYTSGTTGRPKGAVLTHDNVSWNTMNQLASVDVLSSDVALCIAPLFHASGLCQVSLPTLWKGGTVVVADGFSPSGLLRAVAEQRITAFGAVPTMLKMVRDHTAFRETDLSSLRYVIYGGSPADGDVAKAWADRGVAVLQGYGMTEAAPGVLLATADDAMSDLLSPGPAHMFVDIALLGPDGVVREPRGKGELLVSGPNVFRGYWNRPEETAACFVDGWFRTGDVVEVDEHGRTRVLDRVKDLIISGGENIAPTEVEAAVETLSGVLECAVVGVPDGTWGEVGAAYVVPEPGRALDEEAIRASLDGRLARFKIPRHVRFVDSLPRTATGKVRKADLRAAFAEQAPGREVVAHAAADAR